MSLQANGVAAQKSPADIIGECATLLDQQKPKEAEEVAKTLVSRNTREVALMILHCPEFSDQQKQFELGMLSGRCGSGWGFMFDSMEDLRRTIVQLQPCCFRRNHEFYIDYIPSAPVLGSLLPHGTWAGFQEQEPEQLRPVKKLQEKALARLPLGRLQNPSIRVGIWCPDVRQNLFLCSEANTSTEWTTEVEGEAPQELFGPNQRKLRVVSKTDRSLVLKEFTGCTTPETMQLLSTLWKGKMVQAPRTEEHGHFSYLRTLSGTVKFTGQKNNSSNQQLDCSLFQVDSPMVSCIALQQLTTNLQMTQENVLNVTSCGDVALKMHGVWVRRTPLLGECIVGDKTVKPGKIALQQEGDAKPDLLDLTTNPPRFIQGEQVYPARLIENPLTKNLPLSLSYGLVQTDGIEDQPGFNQHSPVLLLEDEVEETAQTLKERTSFPMGLIRLIFQMCNLQALTLPQKLLTGELQESNQPPTQ